MDEGMSVNTKLTNKLDDYWSEFLKNSFKITAFAYFIKFDVTFYH